MSLISSIQLAKNTLHAQQIGLQVAGQNISNANTPGYIREEVVFTPAPTQKFSGLLLGLGVEVTAVIQKIDEFLEQRLRKATSDRGGNEVLEQTYLQLEGIIGELSDTDLSTALSKFSATIQDVLNQPESIAARNLAVLQGQTLAQDIVRLSGRVRSLRSDVNDRVVNVADEINSLVEEIRVLNLRIANVEGGNISNSVAVGLRDRRHLALSKLSELIEINIKEQPNGAVSVFVGGDFLVLEGFSRPVEAVFSTDLGLALATVQIAETESPLTSSTGQLAGLLASRDDVLRDFLEQLDDFARTLAFDFNRIFTSGQGLSGFQELVSEFGVDDPDLALTAAGLPFTPVNGSFDVQVLNTQTGLTSTTHVNVRLLGLDDDTTLTDLAAELDAVGVLQTSISASGILTIESLSPDQDFTFSNDTSGVLAALGLNSFFTGSTAGDLGVNEILRDDPGKFAASGSGIGPNTQNAIALVDFLDAQLEAGSGDTLTSLYERMVGQVTQSSAVARGVSEGARIFEETLRGQQLGVSGVSLDEEAIRMIQYQHTYQAAAKYISTLRELLEVLISL